TSKIVFTLPRPKPDIGSLFFFFRDAHRLATLSSTAWGHRVTTSSNNQHARALRFAALHRASNAFVIPNPWDAGSARVLTSLGFEARATTSAGLAFALGRRDGEALLTRDDALANAAAIV